MPTENYIIQAISEHVSYVGGTYPGWYVGVTADPKDRLFSQHNVQQKEDAWIFHQALSSDAARRVEQHFLDRGMDGGPGGGDGSSSYVYCYKKSSNTNP
jgi:hypothetical protein